MATRYLGGIDRSRKPMLVDLDLTGQKCEKFCEILSLFLFLFFVAFVLNVTADSVTILLIK